MTDPNPYDVPPETTPLDELDQPSHEDCNLAMIAHISGLLGVFTAGYVGFLGPLVVYLLKKDASAFVEEQSKEALNFQITMLLLSVVLGAVVAISCGFLFPLLFITPVLQVIFGIIASLAVRDGKPYRYPMNLRLIR